MSDIDQPKRNVRKFLKDAVPIAFAGIFIVGGIWLFLPYNYYSGQKYDPKYVARMIAQAEANSSSSSGAISYTSTTPKGVRFRVGDSDAGF